MAIRKEITRQFIELIKLYLVGQIIPLLLVANQLSSAENQTDLILQGLNMPFFMIFALVYTYPFIAVWFLWLATAHFFAVRKKYFGQSVFGSNKALNLLINRPLILTLGIIVFALATSYAGSYPISFFVVIAFGYSMYLLLSSIAKKRANA
jgi:hypothetical protein